MKTHSVEKCWHEQNHSSTELHNKYLSMQLITGSEIRQKYMELFIINILHGYIINQKINTMFPIIIPCTLVW